MNLKIHDGNASLWHVVCVGRHRRWRPSLQVVEQEEEGFQPLLLVQIELEVAAGAHVGVGVEHVQVHV